MVLAAGSGTLRVNADATDQLTAATIRAQAPAGLTGASLIFIECPTRTATPAMPTSSAIPNLRLSRWVLRIAISEIVMNAGIVAITTAATPEGTRFSAQNKSP